MPNICILFLHIHDEVLCIYICMLPIAISGDGISSTVGVLGAHTAKNRYCIGTLFS